MGCLFCLAFYLTHFYYIKTVLDLTAFFNFFPTGVQCLFFFHCIAHFALDSVN